MTVCPCVSDAVSISFLSATSGESICRFLVHDLLGHSVAEIKHLVSVSTSGISRFRIQLLMSGRVLSEEEIPFPDDSCYSSSVHIVFLCGRRPTSAEVKFLIYSLSTCNPMGLQMVLMKGIDPSTFTLRTSSGKKINVLQMALGSDMKGGMRGCMWSDCVMNPPIMSEMLVDARANINMGGTDGLTPLMTAVLLGYEAGVTLLLLKGADPNRTTALRRETALHIAARSSERRRFSIVRQLISKRADVSAKTMENDGRGGQTAVDIALWKGCDAMVDLLRSALL